MAPIGPFEQKIARCHYRGVSHDPFDLLSADFDVLGGVEQIHFEAETSQGFKGHPQGPQTKNSDADMAASDRFDQFVAVVQVGVGQLQE